MADQRSELEQHIRRLIAIAGPMPVSEFMDLCLGHPQHGYYITRDPFGGGGDFTTAPEISQMFGELVGVWAVAVWRQMGSPSQLRLIEFGPGRGTMMSDALRATKVVADFREAASIHLVETSPKLREYQENTLIGAGFPASWHATLAEIPAGPTIILANEFVDALPVNQVVKQDDGWHERRIGIGDDDRFVFTTAPEPIAHFDRTLPAGVRSAAIGDIFEWRSDRVVLDICRRLKSTGGAALVIDYGHVASAVGDTFQAVRSHRFTDPLAAPGEVDLTAHVDFDALAASAESIGVRVHGPVTQTEFLMRLGIEKRAATLKTGTPDKTSEIDAALERLTDRSQRGMGSLFKVIGLSASQLAGLPGLEKSSDLSTGGAAPR
jgi:NADH dehydrogenase [ubiquinone] 1 alpha subcomplex assembly factor 7